MNHMLEMLQEHPFLKGMSARHLEVLARECVHHAQFEPRQLLFREGEDARRFWLLRHGRVALEVHAPARGPLTIETVGPGEVVGWSWLVPPYKWQFDARALELTRAIELDGERLRACCMQDHELGFELYQRFAQVIASRLTSTRLQLMDLYGVQV